MSSKTEEIANLYKELAAVPSVCSCAVIPGDDDKTMLIHSSWVSQDLVKLEEVKFSRDYIFDKENLKVVSSGIPHEKNSVEKQSFSPSGKTQAIVRSKKSNSGSSNGNYDLEIWSGVKKEKTFELSERDEFEKINLNAFGCLSWSSDEKFVLFTAEAKKPKGKSYFKVEDNKDNNSKNNKGEQFIYREEWGENFVGSHHSIAVILNLDTGDFEPINVNEMSIGETIWGPDDETIIFVGYNENPRLGVRSCTNRCSAIYAYCRKTNKLVWNSKPFNDQNYSVRIPRFSPDFKSLFYFENKAGGPHFKGSVLQKCDWETKEITSLVDLVDNPTGNEFPGLYVLSVPQKCFFKNYLCLTSQWQSYISILCINTDDGSVQRINSKVLSHPDGEGESFGSSVLFNVYENFLFAGFSSPNIEDCLVIGSINDDSTLSVSWKYMDSNAPVKHHDIEWGVIKMKADKPELSFEAILITPSNKKNVTSAIIRPHGGPHSSYSPCFSPSFVAFTKLQYVNCLVNYRGSIGFGENSINSLPGNVGTQDVEDVQQVAEWVKGHPDMAIQNSFVIGGSHGGFLSAHLIGQYPEFYKAAVLLNPVIDIAGMTETTDIPDWNWVEGGCGDRYDPGTAINTKNLKSMWERSPIKYIENVCTPVLLLLGSKDLRVPYYQGLKYYRTLKTRNVPVDVYVYEDCHSLSKPPNGSDVFMQTALWLEKYST